MGVEGSHLLEAGRGLLEEISGASQPGSYGQYLSRVARNLLQITAREVKHGPGAIEAETKEILPLLGQSDSKGHSILALRRELSTRFRNGPLNLDAQLTSYL